MDFRHLEYFVEIAREKSITRAADKLFVSQSAVNQYLLKLEKDLGAQLFIRHRRFLELTQAGKIYLRGCERALLVRKDTLNEIHDLVEARSGMLTVGLTHARGLTMFTSIYPKMKTLYPHLKITPVEMSATDQQTALTMGELDLGFLIIPKGMQDSLQYVELGQEEILLLIPEGHPLCKEYPREGQVCPSKAAAPSTFRHAACPPSSRGEPQAAATFAPNIAACPPSSRGDTLETPPKEPSDPYLPVINLNRVRTMPFALTREGSSFRKVCDRIFRDAGIEPEILLETSNTSHVAQITEIGECCGLLPYYYADFSAPHYRCFRLQTHPTWTLYIARRGDAILTQAARTFIELSKAYWADYDLMPASCGTRTNGDRQ